ncbi:ABC transporter ATP-binding protein [Miltoncostaea oceani]|uniref:ABC transporter ATP-binding protein n=1 Tax=Miltoncostaea oceani TaxID=2843216 RepID=UPI001C3E7D45|nr:ABC transporter ATP-binding protein [Miltoncostaea oceani]
MSSEPLALRVDGIGKRYRLGEANGYRTLREGIASLGRRRRHVARESSAEMWALRDVTFDVRSGEVVGVIGRNGAGKSTLLKVLSRITEPTEGEARVTGRVGALLEVGTGFHPELTGRENILLNGAILGMRRADIRRNLDAIVAFAEIERFLDTPVKRYSTGMQMRLAFAVAAHLEPEILVIDEVLAVGDAEFQRKCLGRMGNVAREGRTVLFVSHNMAAVESLCDRVLWLEGGRVVADGPAGDVVSRYLQASFSPDNDRSWTDPADAPGDEHVRVRRARVRPVGGSADDPIDVGTPFDIEIEYWNLIAGARIDLSLHVYNEQGVLVFNAAPLDSTPGRGLPRPAGLYREVCSVPARLMNDGVHTVEMLVVRNDTEVVFGLSELVTFNIRDDLEGRGSWYGGWAGAVRPRLDWSSDLVQEGPPSGRVAT